MAKIAGIDPCYIDAALFAFNLNHEMVAIMAHYVYSPGVFLQRLNYGERNPSHEPEFSPCW